MQYYREIRESMEEEGYKLQDRKYENLLKYARRKAKTAGKDESYLPMLLPDVIKEYFFRAHINLAGLMAMEGSNI